MTKITMEKIVNGVEEKLKDMTNRANSIQAYFARVAYPTYQKAQIERWQSENASQGKKWEKLDPIYAKRKLVKFAGFEYAGTKMLIATGDLFKSVVGPGSKGHQAKFTNTSMTVGTDVSYAGYVAEIRPFMKFSDATIKKWKDDLSDFIMGVI